MSWDESDEESVREGDHRIKNGGGRSQKVQNQGARNWQDAISGLVLDPVGFSVFGREGVEKMRES